MASDPKKSPSAPPRPTVNTTGEMRQLGAGRKLGRYTLLRRIASGGMAEVYAARSHGVSGFEKKVAIKKILPQYSMNERFIEMLVDEAKIAVTLTHPNIAQIYELGLEDDTYYIVMEFVEGRPLNRLLQKVDARGHRTIPIEHAVHTVAEVAKGLHHAHEQRDPRGQKLNIVHRDVSPQNVMLAFTGDVKLIDFGIARAQGKAAQTNVGTIKGKLRYLAPEIAQGLEPDHRADVYCAGIVLFELLTGEALYAPRTDVEAIEMASQAKVRSPRASVPEIPVELEEIVMRALKRDRDERYPTAKALSVDLRRFLNAYSPAFVGSELGDYMHALFEAEIAEDRRLDALAERVLSEGTPSSPPPPPPRDASAVEIAPATHTQSGGYREIVSRTEIPLEATPLQVAIPARDTTLLEPDTRVTASALAPTRRPGLGAKAGVALGLAVLGFASFNLARDKPIEPLAPLPPRVSDLPAIEGRVIIDVTPPVAIDVELEGRLLAQRSLPPVTVRVPVRDHAQELLISAPGFTPSRETVLLRDDNQIQLETRLRAIEAHIQLVGLEPGTKVSADVGLVEGEFVTGIPLGATATLRIERKGALDVVKKVVVNDAAGVVVQIPKAARVVMGTLFANSRPSSEVLLNKRPVGGTPLTLSVPPGSYTVTFRSPGKSDRNLSIEVKPGQRAEAINQW